MKLAFDIDITDLSHFKAPNRVRKQYRCSIGNYQYNITKEPNSGYIPFIRNLLTGEQTALWRYDITKMDKKGTWGTLREAKQQLEHYYYNKNEEEKK